MLNHISPVFSPELLAAVYAMGHGDTIVLADGNFPSDGVSRRGAAEIILIAGLGGRVDHTLSTLGILEMLNKTGRRGMVTDGKNRVRLLQNGSLLLARDVRYRYLSLLTLSEKAKGVSLEGCKYPLHGATLTRTRQYAVSNEITGNAALIAVRRGTLFVVESAD